MGKVNMTKVVVEFTLPAFNHADAIKTVMEDLVNTMLHTNAGWDALVTHVGTQTQKFDGSDSGNWSMFPVGRDHAN